MDDGQNISSTKTEKQKKRRKDEIMTKNDPDFEKNVSKKKKKKKKIHNKEDTKDGEKLSPKKVKESLKSKEEKEKSDQNSEEDQLLISDVTKLVGELFEEMKKETESLSKTSKNKKKKKKDKNQEADEDRLNTHMVFKDDDDNLDAGKAGKKKKSKSTQETTKPDNSDVGIGSSTLCTEISSSDCVKTKKKKEKSNVSVPSATVDNDNDSCDMNSLDDDGKKKSKKKKAKGVEKEATDMLAVNNSDVNINDESKKKKKKKDKSNNEDIDTKASGANATVNNSGVNTCDGSKKKKKKKKDKSNDEDIDTKASSISDMSTVNNSDVNVCGENKKRKRSKSNGQDCDIKDNGVDKDVSMDGQCRKKKRKEKDSDVESDSCNKSTLDEQGPNNSNCNSERKKKKKKKDKSQEDNGIETLVDTVELNLKSEKESPNASENKKKKRKSEGANLENDKLMKKERKENNDPVVKTPFQQSLKSPVFESEERKEKFKRLLGGEKNKDSSSNNSAVDALNENNISSPSVSAGQWKGMMFENADRQSKFIRLLGGAKPSADKKKGLFASGSTTPKKGLFGSLTSKLGSSTANGCGGSSSKALGLEAAASLDQSLEDDFNRALSRRLGGMGSSGIGFAKDPAEGKKFHINTNAVKSTQFTDDD